MAPVGFSVCSPRVDAPGMGGLDGGRQEITTKFSSQKSQGQPQDAPSAIACRRLLHLAFTLLSMLRICSAWDN